MANQLIGNIVALIVIVGFGFGLSRWFDWRRSLQRRLLDAAEGAGDIESISGKYYAVPHGDGA